MIMIAALVFIRTVRARHPNPKYIPTPFLKRLWKNWKVPTARGSHSYEQADHDEETAYPGSGGQNGTQNTSGGARTRNGTATTPQTGVDRNVSVRSVMTLPVYRSKPDENEQVLGREGERDGIDVVVELPTAEVEEALREEEMDALYQIRAARRRQIADREERRRLRREARDAGNVVALQQLRDVGRTQSDRNVREIEELRGEHERIRETRQRAVSSVSYADLGVARADGTRLRANSTESERIGLLSDAASIAASRPESSLLHRRDRSTSALSIDTTRSNDLAPDSPGMTTTGSHFSLASAGHPRSRANSGANTPRLSTRAGSSPEIIDAEDGDLGDSIIPPPGYDEVSLDEITPMHSGRTSAMSGRISPYPEPPPDYPGPALTRNNRLSAQMEDLAAQAAPEDGRQRTSPRSSGVTPHLPSLRLSRLPQIVIDGTSARP